jgi:hypothetical protein
MFQFYDFELIYGFHHSRTISSPRARRAIGGPQSKEDYEIIKMVEAIMDKVVDQLLNEAAEVVLKED